MINVKKIVKDLLDTSTLEENNVEYMCGYPDSVETFPLVCWYENGQGELEYSDNKATYNNCEIEIHIFSKKLSGYLTTMQIAFMLNSVFNADYWTCTNNREVADIDNEIEHRILNYRKEFLF